MMSKSDKKKKIEVEARYEGATPEMLGRALLRPRQPNSKQRERKPDGRKKGKKQ